MDRTYCLFSCSFSPSYYISQYYSCYSLARCPLPYVAGTTLFFLFSSLYCFYVLKVRSYQLPCCQHVMFATKLDVLRESSRLYKVLRKAELLPGSLSGYFYSESNEFYPYIGVFFLLLSIFRI